jgi:integrase
LCEGLARDLKGRRCTLEGWHAFRRGLATNLHDLGVDDLTIQRILRHGDVTTTRKSYIKTIPRQVVSAMSQLEAVVVTETLQ